MTAVAVQGESESCFISTADYVRGFLKTVVIVADNQSFRVSERM